MNQELLTSRIPLIGVDLSSPRDLELVVDFLRERYHVRNLEECPEDRLDLVIVDGLSLENNLDLIKRLKAERESWIPVLLCTANRSASYLTRYLWQVIDELIFVPVEKIELLARVEILLRGRNYSLLLAEKLKTELEEKSRQLTLAVQDLRVVLWRVDLRERKVYLSGNLREMFGINVFEKEMSLTEWLDSLMEDDRIIFNEKISRPEPSEYEDMIIRWHKPDRKEMACFSLRFNVIRDILNRPQHLFGLLFDITDLYRSERALQLAIKEKDLLLKELFHRTKNNMQIIYSFLSIYKDRMAKEEIRKVLEEVQGHILSVATVHQHLYLAKSLSAVDIGGYLGELLENLKGLYRFIELKVELEKPKEPVNLEVEIVTRLGLLISEMINNSCRHGFKGRESGNIKVRLNYRPGFVELEYADDGNFTGDYNRFLKSDGIGKTLIMGLVQQMSGKIDFIPGQGFHFILVIPV